MNSNSPHPSGRVRELDGLRGVLALWVLAGHICCWCGMFDKTPPFNMLHTWYTFVSGEAPVEMFIILSGFAITYALSQSRQNYFAFIWSRFFRIYPIYLICLLIAIGTSSLVPYIVNTATWRDTIYFTWLQNGYLTERANFWEHIGAHLTLLNGLIPKQILANSTGAFLSPAWSITLEWQFYLVAPLMLAMVRSAKGIVALGVIALLGTHYAPSWDNDQLAFLPAQLLLFLAGIGSYHLYAWLKSTANGGSRTAHMPVAIMVAAALATYTDQTIALAGWALVFGCVLIRGDDLFAKSLAVVRKVLLHPLLQFAGAISFPLYLIHWPMITLLLHTLLSWQPAITWPEAVTALFLVGAPIIVLAAYILHRLVEVPGRQLGKWLWNLRHAREKTEPSMTAPIAFKRASAG